MASPAFPFIAVVAAVLLLPEPSLSAPLGREAAARTPLATDVSAQSRERRAPARIRVTPRYPYRTFHSPYPLPYNIEYPGPNAVRECRAQLVKEWRLSGTVVVPRMHCWWVLG
jgi:hypothetical protein